MRKIFITRNIPGNVGQVLTDRGFEVTLGSNAGPLSRDELLSSLRKTPYDAVLSLLNDRIDAEVFDAAPTVKLYANYAVGFNNIDVAEAKRRGITVTNTPSDAVNESVAEHTFALLLSLVHRVAEGDSYIRNKQYKGWDPNLLIGTDSKGKTLGVLGAGRIGSLVIQKGVQGFGMNVVYYDVIRNERLEREYGAVYALSVEEVLKAADVLTLHVLLTAQTTHLINKERLSLMKPGAYLINTCRGPVVDEKALVSALSAKQLRGAALDVFEFEPEITKELLALPSVVLTPHIASATDTARLDMSQIAVRNVLDFFEGKQPPNAVR